MKIKCFYTPPDDSNRSKKRFWKKSFSEIWKVRTGKNLFFVHFSHRARKKGEKILRLWCVLSFLVYSVHIRGVKKKNCEVFFVLLIYTCIRTMTDDVRAIARARVTHYMGCKTIPTYIIPTYIIPTYYI